MTGVDPRGWTLRELRQAADGKMRDAWSRASLLAALIHNASYTPALPLSAFDPFAASSDGSNVVRLTPEEMKQLTIKDLF